MEACSKLHAHAHTHTHIHTYHTHAHRFQERAKAGPLDPAALSTFFLTFVGLHTAEALADAINRMQVCGCRLFCFFPCIFLKS